MNRQTREEALRIDAMGYNWTPHRDKCPLYPGWNRAPPSDYHFINTAFQETPFIANGIRTGRDKAGQTFLVIDFDERSLFDAFIANIRIETTVASTRRGTHLFVRGESPNRLRVGGQRIDLIADRKFVCAPVEARGRELVREWLSPLRPVEQLAEYDPDWFPEIRTEVVRRAGTVIERPLEWARETLYRDHWSVSDSNGDTALFKAACFLVQIVGLDDQTALAWLREWNLTNAKPSWQESRLVYKISEARRLMK